jgi:hypothetical protein
LFPHLKPLLVNVSVDIIEEILGHEIVDETDAFVDGTHAVKVDRSEAGFEWAKLRLLGSKIVDERLSYTEAKAITAHLLTNYPRAVSLLTENQVHRLVADTVVTVFPTAKRELGKDLPDDLLYQKGVPSDVCTLILSGKVTVITGEDEFRTDVSSWTLLGMSALKDAHYKPDFTAFVCNGPCRCIQFTRASFNLALDASASEKHAIQEDQFRSLALDKPNGVGAASTAPSAGEAQSEISESVDNGSERGTSRKEDRRSKLIAALQIAKESEPEFSVSHLDAVPSKSNNVCYAGGPPDTSISSINASMNDALGLGVYHPGGNARRHSDSATKPHAAIGSPSIAFIESEDKKDSDAKELPAEAADVTASTDSK